jgi:hypothetical protein
MDEDERGPGIEPQDKIQLTHSYEKIRLCGSDPPNRLQERSPIVAMEEVQRNK